MDKQCFDAVVIGAGVIGLAIARVLAMTGRQTLVLEANPRVGMETSSRNSEVIHAGLHYVPGSLKATSCVQGKALLYGYCARKGIPHRRIGKLIVATNAAQADRLRSIRANARACGVVELDWLDAHRLELMEPAIRAQLALWSPSTGIVDSHALMQCLQADLEAAGGTVACNTRVDGASVTSSGIELRIRGESLCLRARSVVNAAGLAAVDLASNISGLPAASIPRVKLVRGQYFTYSGRSPFSHLVYPVPQDDGLGIHATLDLAGQLRFGPDAVQVDTLDYAIDDSRRPQFSEAIRRWYPDLDDQRLRPGYTGIRPQLSSRSNGFSDFMLSGPTQHGVPGLVSLFGIESPGLTACLALAERVGEIVEAA